MVIRLRLVKGSELTYAEMDENFTDLRDGVNLMVPSDQTKGIKVDSLGTPVFGWHDLRSNLYTDPDTPATLPTRTTYRGGIKALQFSESDECFIDFHLPHDYLMGSDIFIHTHWSHTGTLVTGGSVTWGFEMMYAKGHDQAPFAVPVIASVADNASTTQYQHMIAEVQASTSGGSGVALDTDDLEVDGIIQCRIYLDSNDLIVSGGGVPEPFLHMVDIHYQSTNMTTKNKTPNFWT